MKFLLLLTAVTTKIAVGFAQAASTTSTDASSTTSSAATTHTVNAGAAGFSFTPETIIANIGDIVKFNFYPTNHSVARADFRYPCIPYEYVETGRQGFYSGFEPVQAILNDPPSFSIEVNDTEPIFFYCSAPGACLDDVMIGVINQNETFSLAIQKEFVANSTFELSPGEPFPTESPRPNPTMPGGYAPATGTSSPSGGSSGLSTGAIAGIAIGGAALLVLTASLIYICGRKGGIEKGYRHAAQPSPAVMESKLEHIPKSSPNGAFPTSPCGMPGRADTNRSTNSRTSLGHWGHQSVSPQPTYHAYFPEQRTPGGGSMGVTSPLGAGQDPRGYYKHTQAPRPPSQLPVELPANDPHRSILPSYYQPRSPSGEGDWGSQYRQGR